MAGAHAEGLPYEDGDIGVKTTIACAADLPEDVKDLGIYTKDIRFNKKTEDNFSCKVPLLHEDYGAEENQSNEACTRKVCLTRID